MSNVDSKMNLLAQKCFIVSGLNESLYFTTDSSSATFGLLLVVTSHCPPYNSIAAIHLTPMLLRGLAKMSTELADAMELQASMPKKPGFYWAKCKGIVFLDKWEVVEVFKNVKDDLLVYMLGVPGAQPIDNFEWGEIVNNPYLSNKET